MSVKFWNTLGARLVQNLQLRVKLFNLGCNIASLNAIPSCEQDSLGLENNVLIPDIWLTSSSKLNANTPAKNGRLNYTAGSSWCASLSDNYPYLEIDLQTLHIICAVSTQGNHEADQWVKTFSLQSSTDGRTWTNYTEDDQVSIKIFSGNYDKNTIVKHILYVGIVARHLRFVVGVKHGEKCMRAAIFGAPRHDIKGDSTDNRGAKNHRCANNIRLAANQEGTFFCKPTASGRYVYIRNPGNPKVVVVCEVEVYSTYLPNLALDQPATQVSVDHGGVASCTVDGNNSTDYGSRSCMHTDYADDSWWRVDLEEPLPVATVVIVNRNCPPLHGCADYTRTFEIRIGNDTSTYTSCGGTLSLANGETKPFYCDPPIVGQYVSVVRLGTNSILTICEVQVYSFQPISRGVTACRMNSVGVSDSNVIYNQ
ncbi:PREDICTED: uncharacterized protein LOC107338920 [Acropora digitifera]|uniref:uncharacterized protein LOC107338920 n=1 Tax=Acropora digitifera TaxID=70779 RepID=UPI00077ADCC3|nr:PREDICTED: uncharacterized protein LOC107338920 [Acropora digitifera]